MAASIAIPVAALLAPITAATAVPAGLRNASIVTSNEAFALGATLDALIEVSFDGGVTWKHEVSSTGMRPTVSDPHIALGVSFGSPGSPYPTHVRTTLTPHGAVTLGATATVS